MVIFKEASSRRKELTQTIMPLLQVYAKATAPPKAIFAVSVRFAEVLDQWDFFPKELKDLDKRAFMDLIASWRSEASAKDIILIKFLF
jgi:hypothetical protein